MRTIIASIDIAAAPEQIWSTIARFDRYSSWNPFIHAIEGRAETDEAIVVTLKLPHGPELSLDATVIRVEAPSVLAWQSGLLGSGLFDREHRIEIESNATGSIVRQTQSYTGVLAPLMAAFTDDMVEHGLAAMNAALKRQVEAVGTN